jgi:hypothetical protein
MEPEDILVDGNISWTGEDIRRRLEAAGYVIVASGTRTRSMRLPREWYEEHDGQRLVLNPDKVEAELGRLRDALSKTTPNHKLLR